MGNIWERISGWLLPGGATSQSTPYVCDGCGRRFSRQQLEGHAEKIARQSYELVGRRLGVTWTGSVHTFNDDGYAWCLHCHPDAASTLNGQQTVHISADVSPTGAEGSQTSSHKMTTARTNGVRYKTLAGDEVNSLVRKHGYFCKGTNDSKTFVNEFQSRTIDGYDVVIDNVTGLMWSYSGSQESMTFSEAQEWVKDLNGMHCAGYSDWRLPTVEEAASLLEMEATNGLYIDPIFSETQTFIWTGNGITIETNAHFVVGFRFGYIIAEFNHKSNFVRPLRSMNA